MVRKIGAGVGLGYGPGIRSRSENHGPTNINLSALSFSSSATIGTVVGTLSTSNADAGTTHTYTIATGGNPSTYFGLSGTSVNIAQSNVPAGTYTLKIRSTDNNGRWIEKTFNITSGVVYSAEAQAIFDAHTVQLNATKKGYINTCIAALKTAGVWTTLDVLYMPACCDDAQQAKINWKAPGTYDLVAVGNPGFIAAQGFTGGNGTADYLTTGFIPSSASGKQMAQNSASIAAYVRTLTTTLSVVFGTTNLRVAARTSSKGVVGVNGSDATYTAAATAYQGFLQGRRVDAVNESVWGNLGTTGAVTAAASTTLPTTQLVMCGSGGASPVGTVHECRAAYAGSGHTDQNVIDLHNNIRTCLTSFGANLSTGLT